MKNPYSKWSVSLTIVALLLARPARAEENPAPSAEALFNEALMKETGERDLEQALVLFRRVAANPENASLTAKAQLRTGFILERLNKPSEAVQAYQNVLTLPITVPTEVAQTAQSNLDRLQTRLERERSVSPVAVPQTTSIAVPPVDRLWRISTDYGATSTLSESDGFPSGQFAFWASVSRRFNRWGSWGLSLGYFGTQKDSVVESEYSDENFGQTFYAKETNYQSSKSIYIGPDFHASLARRQWSIDMSAGIGANIAWVDVRPEAFYSWAFNNVVYHQELFFPNAGRTNVLVRPAIPLSISAEWHVMRNLSIGGGLRDFIILDADNRNSERSGSVIARHVLVPFGRVAVQF